MKKIIVFLLLVLLLCGVSIGYTKGLSFKDIFEGCEMEVYLPVGVNVECSFIENGEGIIAFCSIDYFKYLKDTYLVNGFTIKIKDKEIDDVVGLLNPNYVIRCDNFIYGYTNSTKCDVKMVQDKIVNFQCVKVENDVCVGFPILLGSY